MTTMFERVVVAGASIAGLLAARVLAPHARELVLLERDRISGQAEEPRKGAPQGHHAHALLAAGQQVLESLFPGLTASLVARGAPTGRGGFYTAGGYLEGSERHASLYASRGLLEAEVRRRVLALPNLRLLEEAQAAPPVLTQGRVGALHVQDLRGGPEQELACELQVDATGRGSRTPAWLAASGYPAPLVERVDVGMRYATRHLRRRGGDLAGRCFFSVSPAPALPRACGILAQEGDRWIVTLVGYFGDQPPADEAGFLRFARSLPAPEAGELVARAEPLDAIRTFSFPHNQRVRYEALAARPAGLLVLGDALASFSPVYGQGMSVAAQQAAVLQRCLVQGRRNLEDRFFAGAAKVVDTPWGITVGNDRQLAPGGPHGSLVQRWRYRWVQRVLRAGQRDRLVAEAFLDVARLLAPPASLLRPGVVARTLRVT